MIKYVILAFLLVGCNTDNSVVNLDWLYPKEKAECTEIECKNLYADVDGYLTDIVVQIDTSTVKLNHYVNEVLVDENYAEVIDIDGHVATKNHIDLPPYVGTPMKHTLIVEFMQIK